MIHVEEKVALAEMEVGRIVVSTTEGIEDDHNNGTRSREDNTLGS